MNWNNLNDEQKAEMIISNLLHMAISDDDFDPRELQYIREVADTLGVSHDRLNYLYKNYKNYDLQPPASESERMSFLYYLLFLVKSDQKITKNEEDLIIKIGFKLGFNELLVRDLIAVITKYLGERVPPNELIEKVKTYLN